MTAAAPDAARAALRDAVGRVAFDGRGGASVDGAPVAATAEGVAGGLYGAWYAGLPVGALAGAVGGAGDDDLRPRLSAANAGREAWDGGWSFERTDLDGRAVARRGIVLRAFWPGQWLRADGVPAPVVPGTPLRVHHPAEALAQPGFWFAHGAGGPDPERRLVRVYLNVGEESAEPLTAALTAALARLAVPFTFKVADRRALLARRDSAVLYVEARHFRLAAELVLDAVEALPVPLGEDAPPLTRPLARGIGVAEEPGDGSSFGMHRCGLVAEGVLRARDGGVEERLDAVEARFAERGVDPERPWLAAATHPDPYGLVAA